MEIHWLMMFKSKISHTQCLQLGFPDFGPDPSFFDQTGPDLVQIFVKSPNFSKKIY